MITIPVTNAGAMDGDEVVQVYVKAVADVDGPIKSLRGFERVNIKAGETVSVEIPFKADLFNPATGKMEQASGDYIIYYGGTSDEAGLNQITVTL